MAAFRKWRCRNAPIRHSIEGPNKVTTSAISDGKIPNIYCNAPILSHALLHNHNNVSKKLGIFAPNNAQHKASHAPEPRPQSGSLSVYKALSSGRNEGKAHSNNSSKITTKQGLLAVVFKFDDYKVKLAQRCKFTLIGKFDNIMPKMEVIRRKFILKIELRDSIKLTYFNSKHLYIDLNNEHNHSTVWSKDIHSGTNDETSLVDTYI